MSTITLVTPSAELPVSLADAKLHLRIIGTTVEDTLIEGLIRAAADAAEHHMGRPLLTSAWRLTLDAFPACGDINVRLGTVTAVTSIEYWPADGGAIATVSSSSYYADCDSSDLQARVRLKSGSNWPACAPRPGAVRVNVTAGWASAAAIPGAVRAWLLLHIGALYENREAWTLGKPIVANEHVNRLLDRYRLINL